MGNTKYKFLYQIAGALLGCFALCLQFYLILSKVPESGKTYLSEIIRFFSYMTIWTNILVTLCFLIPVVAENSRLNQFLSKPIIQTGVFLYITIVSLGYHFLLSHIWSPTGLQKIADSSLHYFVPAAYILYWFLFVKKGGQKFSHSIKWLIYPLIYIIYALIYGAISNTYTYPFIDVSVLGYGIVLRNCLFLAVTYVILSILIVLLDKLMKKLFE